MQAARAAGRSTMLLIDASPMVHRFSLESDDPDKVLAGIMKWVHATLRRRSPTWAAFVCDSKGSSRSKNQVIDAAKAAQISSQLGDVDLNAFPVYKESRKSKVLPPIIFETMDKLPSLGLPLLKRDETEADDIIASMAKIALSSVQDAHVTIFSPDKDFFQLLSPQVTIGRRWGWSPDVDADWFVAKYGFQPHLHVDLLALMGDAADSVPGVRGIGPVFAQKLVAAHGSVEDVIKAAEADRMESPRLRDMILKGKASALLSKQLVKLNDSLDLSDALVATKWK